MGKDEDSIQVLLDIFQFDAEKLSEHPIKLRKEVLKIITLGIIFTVSAFATINLAKIPFYLLPQMHIAAIYMSAIPLIGVSRAFYKINTLRKSKKRILKKWNN